MVKKKYPEGHFVAMWIALGIPLGIPIGFAMGNAGVGPAIGVAIGAAIGSAVEAQAKKEGKIRPLTKTEKARQKKYAWIALALAVLVAFLVISFFLFV